MRRLFIIRKDLHLSAGKLAAMVGHCAEAYWTHLLRESNMKEENDVNIITIQIPVEIMKEYVNGSFIKTICQAKNLNNLMKAKEMALQLGLIEGKDFGFINDNCLTELTPENEDGTCTVGIWFKPLPDDVAHSISKKYHLYMG